MKLKGKNLKKSESELESKFKVGDIVRCKKSCEKNYYVTKSNVFLKVLLLYPKRDPSVTNALVSVVHALKRKDFVAKKGESYMVNLEYFDIVPEKNMQVYLI